MEIVHIEPDDCKRLPAPWIFNRSAVQELVVRIRPSQRWRRVYFFAGLDGQKVDGRANFFYVNSKEKGMIEVILPKHFSSSNV